MKKQGRTAPTYALIAISILTVIAPSLHARSGGVRLPASFTAEPMSAANAATLPDGKVPAADEEARKRAAAQYGKLPLVFEANAGQFDARVKFTSRGSGYNLYLTKTEAVLALRKPAADVGRDGAKPQTKGAAPQEVKQAVLRMQPIGGNPKAEVSGADEQPGKSNYFVGGDSGKWRREVPTYGRVEYKEVYRGVDMVYYGNQGQLEYDFVVAPGVDPRVIRLRMEGAKGIRIDKNGELVVGTAVGEVRQQRPVIYQEVGGERREVAGRYVLLGRRDVGFRVGSYDRTRPLVIDPVLSYSTYLGGGRPDYGRAITLDGQGNAYVTGETFSFNFPVTGGAYQTTYQSDYDVFVTKLNAEGTDLVFSTYLGGNERESGQAIALDGSGNVYVTGHTNSDTFPTTPGAFDTLRWSQDIFVTKLSGTGDTLIYSTLLGGKNDELGRAIAVDGAGTAYVTGETSSADFPTTAGAYKTGLTNKDAFISRLNATGTGLLYSTFLGGGYADSAAGIAVDAEGYAYIVGSTSSDDFPTTDNAFQKTFGSVGVSSPAYYFEAIGEAFVTKMNATGTALVYSTYLGGLSDETGTGIAIDGSGNAYVSGSTFSVNFPTTAGAVRTANGGVFRTANAAGAWGASNKGLATGNITAIAINPALTSTLYASTAGKGVFRSSDSGATWVPINAGLTSENIYTLAVDPISPSTIYTGTQGKGIFKSTDGGGTWNTMNIGLDTLHVVSIAIDRTSPSTIYACGEGSYGVFKSTNGGGTWAAVNTGLGNATVRALAIDPSNSSTVYVGSNGYVSTLYKSTNGGASWNSTALNLNGAHILCLTVSTADPLTVYVGTRQGVYKSNNGGENWQSASQGLTNKVVNALTPSPADPLTIYAGTDDAIFKSTDGGGNWSPASTGLQGALVSGIAVDPVSPSIMYASTSSASVDVFVAKLNSAGSALTYSTLIGGGLADEAAGIAVNSSGNAYVAGSTNSLNFPVASGGYHLANPSNRNVYDRDAFITKLNGFGTALAYSTHLGGSGSDGAAGIAVDSTGSAYVVGSTSSSDFPLTASAYQNQAQSGTIDEAFVAKLLPSPSLSADLKLTQSVAVANVPAGAFISYTITVTNEGPDLAQSLTITSIASDLMTLGSCNSPLCTSPRNRATLIADSLALGKSLTFKLPGTLKCSVPEGILISNTTQVESLTSDPDLSSNFASVTFPAPEQVPLLTPWSRSHTSGGDSGTVKVEFDGCPWTATSDADWITITSGSGFDTGYVTYTVAANSGPDRTGTITIRSRKFIVFQSSPTATTVGVVGRVNITPYEGLAGVTMTFSRVTPGTGPVPPPVQTDPDGYWSQSGFEKGVAYQVTPSRKRFSFSPTSGNFTAISPTPYFEGKKNADTAGVFRPSNGALYLKNVNDTGFADLLLTYGLPGDYPISGDWDGDGIDTIGIYRNGTFYLRNSNTNGFADVVVAFGSPGDQPVVGDWDGDGIDTIGVYRNGTFMLRNSNTTGAPDMVFELGIPGDIGIAGDWDGDGVVTTGVFRPTNGALYLKNANSTGFADLVLTYGLPGDKPVVGDWNGDGVDTIGVYRQGTFMLRNSNTNGFAEVVFTLGVPEDHPISGDWNGLP